jgi:UDP-glucose 4-epimerase
MKILVTGGAGYIGSFMVKRLLGHEDEVVIVGVNFSVKVKKRRPGDADILVADVSKIKKELGFIPKCSDLETIVKSAWEWHKKHNGQ